MRWLWIFIFFLIVFVFIVIQFTRSSSVPASGELVYTNCSSTPFEVMMVDASGNFIVMVDTNGAPLVVYPQSSIHYKSESILQMIYVNPDSLELKGIVMANIKGKRYDSYWGGASSDWLLSTSSNSIQTLSTISPVHETNPIIRVEHPFRPSFIEIQDQSLFPSSFILFNYINQPVTFKVYTLERVDTFSSISPNAFVTVSLPTCSYVTIISFVEGGGIQGRVMYHVNGLVSSVYLFGQAPLPSPQSIGLFTS